MTFFSFKYFKYIRIRIHLKNNVFVFEYIFKMGYLYSYVFDICLYSTPCLVAELHVGSGSPTAKGGDPKFSDIGFFLC